MKNESMVVKEIQDILADINIDEHIDNYFEEKRDYSDNEEYQKLKKQYDSLNNYFNNQLEKSDLRKLDELKNIIREIEWLDTRTAYKIGLIEGITIKNEVIENDNNNEGENNDNCR